VKLSTGTPLQDERFLLLETLGHGAMGSVYRAFDRAEQRLVALKVPCEAEPSGPGHSLSTEFDTWHRLRHRNIVRAYELALARKGPIPADTPYLVLEHVDGGPVHRVLHPGRVEDRVTEVVAVQLLEALERVHDAGFVHRDLKPANVLAGKLGNGAPRVRLTDFGLATPMGSTREPGVFSGSLPYVAPEAMLGRPLDGRTDLYGLGILLFHLATGSMPCRGEDPREILLWHLTGPPADPRTARPATSDRLARFVRRLTEREPADRPASATEALRLLGAARRPATAFGSCRVGQAARASLRLALDAARLGAARLFPLPADVEQADALLLEVAVWTQVRGLELHRSGATRQGLARLVLRLAVERGTRGAAWVRRHGLSRFLPLDWLGDLPIFDPRRTAHAPSVFAGPALRNAANSICEFFWRCARERSLVVCLDASAGCDPLGREIGRRMEESVGQARGFARRRGGLLLLLIREA